MNDYEFDVRKLNRSISEAHDLHYRFSPTGLIDCKQSPNQNLIYHLYNDGEITFQKGSTAYLERSEFTLCPSLYALYRNSKLLPMFAFPKANDGRSYAVLTESQCVEFREEIGKILKSEHHSLNNRK